MDAKPLLWKTGNADSWNLAMKELADVYVGVRAREVNGIKKLDPQNGERHLLGIPLTRHSNAAFPKRYSSPLRFFVRKKKSKFSGYILHLPYLLTKGKGRPELEKQIEVWTKVHKKLDHLVSRAGYEECL